MYPSLNRVFTRLVPIFVLALIASACQQATITPVGPLVSEPQPTNSTQITENVSIPIGNITPDILQAAENSRPDNKLVTAATGNNLLANPSFESGANAWVACDVGSSLLTSNDSVSNLALKLSTGCMYQDVIIRPNSLYTLTCKAKLTDPTGWSGMGFGLMDSTFTSLAAGPESTITGAAWADYTISFTSPENSGFAAIWFYTDGTVLIDDCSFSTKTLAPADPKPVTLIPNGSFDTQGDWSNCGNPAGYTIADGKLNQSTPSCIYQTIEATVGADYRLTCTSQADANVYSSISLSMLNSAWAPLATDTKVVTSATLKAVDLAKVAPAGTKHVAVTFYSNGPSTHDECALTISTLSHEVPTPDGTLQPYPSSHPTNIEPSLVANNLLVNPSFTTQTGWANCAPTSATIAAGKLAVTPGVCFFQQVDAEIGKTYSLTCKGNMDLPLYSVVTLNMLDVNYQTVETKAQAINTSNRPWRVELVAPATTRYVTVGFYTETPASYDYCYLSTEGTPTPVIEKLYPAVKPMEILVPIYIDPAQDPTPWNQVIATAATVPTTVVVNPVIGGIEGCQEASFKTMLGQIQAAKVDTIGYIPTGYTLTPTSVVKERIELFKKCEGIDGVFFDEIKVSNQAEADYYIDICNYAKIAFGGGKHVVNAGTNIQLPISNEFCNIALIYEFFGENWEDFAVFGYEGASTDAATSIMIHTSNTIPEMKASIDLAYARKIDYVYVTDKTIPNPWIFQATYWTEMVNHIALKNAPFN